MAKALKSRPGDTLTDQQRDFCREYVKDFNASKAAIRAKYSRKTARKQGSRLLTKEDVVAEIRRLTRRAAAKIEVNPEGIVQKFAQFADGNVFDYIKVDAAGKPSIDITGLGREDMAPISSIKVYLDGSVELKLASRERALENLSRIFKVEPPKRVKVEHEGEIGVTHRVRQEYTLNNEELRKRVAQYLIEHKPDGGKS